MSWITGLADKAENILNKIDQNAATALQIPPGSETAFSTINVPHKLDEMRKSLSSSTQSLKTTLSPMKLSRGAKNDNSNGMTTSMSDSVESREKLEWPSKTDQSEQSRRSSVSSKAGSIAIDIAPLNNVAQTDLMQSTSTLKLDSTVALGTDSQELAAFKIALSEVSNERDEMRLRLTALNRDIESASLRQRIDELELLVLRLTEERDQAQHELYESQTASGAYVHSISELETNLAKLQQEYLETAQKLQMQIQETAQQRQELQEYRTKAHRALQMKDNLIAELKSNNGTTVTATDSETRLLNLEFDALKQEHQQLLEEHNNVRLQLDETRQDWNMLNTQHSEQLNELRAREHELRKELRYERERLIATESEQRVLTQELNTLRQQLSNQMAGAATRLQEKEQQLQQLRAVQVRKKSASDEDNQDMRLKTLTQALVDKQNTLENITAERNALRIQLEKMQDQLQQINYNNSVHINAPRNALLSNSTDDVKAQYPLLLMENPFDNRVARRVKRAYSSLDSAGIRLGAFLRRYPLMRIFVLMYVGLLHIWVMFVLLSSTPN